MTKRDELVSVVLTVADHEQNGFVALCKWRFGSEAEAREFIANIDSLVSDDSEPDVKTAAFTFVLDLWTGNGCEDTGKKWLPLQVAMSLAQSHVGDWLNDRPVPDDVINRRIPIMERVAA